MIEIFRKKDIRAVIFDFRGVVVKDPYPAMLDDIAEECRIPSEKRDEAGKVMLELMEKYEVVGIDRETVWMEFKQRTGAVLPQNYKGLWTRKYNPETNQDVEDIIKSLQRNNYVTSLLSNAIPCHTDAISGIADSLGLSPVILSCNGSISLDGKVREELCSRENIEPKQCVYVATPERIAEKPDLDLRTVPYHSAEKLRRYLQKNGANLSSTQP